MLRSKDARMAAIRRANNIRQNVKNQIIDRLLRPDDAESVGGNSQSYGGNSQSYVSSLKGPC